MPETMPGRLTPGRQRVLDAALQMFSERGYEGTSMRDLAEALHLQPASVYTHYRGKDELLCDALAPLLDGLDDVIALGPHLPADRALPLWLQGYVQLLANHPKAARLAGADLAVARHPRIGERLAQQNAHARRHLTLATGCSETTAASALGALWWPYICLPLEAANAADAAVAAERILQHLGGT